MENTLISKVADNIGQVDKSHAQSEIDRLNKQQNIDYWRVDSSDYLYCPDEFDPRVNNPCKLSPGFVWVTKTPIK